MRKDRKQETLQEQLERISAELEQAKENVKRLKKEKKDLEEKIKIQELIDLDELRRENGKTIEEVKAFLKN